MNSPRLRRFDAPGRVTSVHSHRHRLVSVAVAATIPAGLLGGLVLAAPDSFAVAQTHPAKIAQPAHETLAGYMAHLRSAQRGCSMAGMTMGTKRCTPPTPSHQRTEPGRL